MALISGKEVKKTEKQEPANPKMYNMVVAQAKAKFTTYPSPAAAHWVRARYNQMGGQYVKSKKEVDPRFRDYAQEEKDKKEELQKKKVTKKVGKANIRGERFR
jgi:hypothetical protein